MIRPLALTSLIALALLPVLPGAARADGYAQRAAAPAWHPPRRAVRHARVHHRHVRPVPGPILVREPDLAYGWLPRNLNLPIYNAPSEGPAPTL